MQAPINNTTPQQRDKDMTDYLYAALRVLPEVIGEIEAEAAVMINQKRETQANLEDAELNAEFSFIAPDKEKKITADEMKRLIKEAVTNDPNVKKLRKEVMRYEAELEMNEAEAKSKRRQFQAAIALAELHAARINMMCHYQTQQATTQKGNHNEHATNNSQR